MKMKKKLFSIIVFSLLAVTAFSSFSRAGNAWFKIDPANAKPTYEPGDVIKINLIADKAVVNLSIGAITTDNDGWADSLQYHPSFIFPPIIIVNENGILFECLSATLSFAAPPIVPGEILLSFNFYVPELPDYSIINIDDMDSPCITDILFADFSSDYDIDPVQLHVVHDLLYVPSQYPTIQAAIDDSNDGDTILVDPGLYVEELDFLGKAITLQSFDEPAVLTAPGYFAVSFYHQEDSNSVLKNFIIKDSWAGILCAGSSPTISNITVVDCNSGVVADGSANPSIRNSIFWDNISGDLLGCVAMYSIVEDDEPGLDPLFADPNNGDYHLKSQRGRYSPGQDLWVLDDVTSPGIDGGDPAIDPCNEPLPNGGRLNMGAYGGSSQASLSGWAPGEIIDPNLLLWYWLDESEPNVMTQDWSGYGYHGLVDAPGGIPNWLPDGGALDGALIFNEDTAIDVPPGATTGIGSQLSISCWLRYAYNPGSDNWIFGIGTGSYQVRAAVVLDGTSQVEWRAGNDTNDVLIWDMGADGIDPAVLQDWHWWVFVKDEDAGQMRLYFNGRMYESKDGVDATLNNIQSMPLKIGALPGQSYSFIGRMDDFQMFDREVGPFCMHRPCLDDEQAWNPSPSDGQANVPVDVVLQWREGYYAEYHDVYFGTDFNDVNDANTTSIQYKGRNVFEDMSYDPCGLLFDTTYYWRIDEANDSVVWKGQIWVFTTADYIVVDDMETYNMTDNLIWDKWIDQPWWGFFVELCVAPEPVHSGF
ncbi:MAG: LamG domain-containing protein, partial [Planctomycetota bacterium]